MSPKAFRLVDEMKAPSEKSAAPQRAKPKTVVSVDCDPEDAAEPRVPEADGIRISDITPLDSGELVSVTLIEGRKRRNYRLMIEQYAALRPAVGDVTAELAEALMKADRLCGAVCKGMELLGYGAVSRRRLIQKLTARKIDQETAEAATDYLMAHGFLPESDDAIRFAEQGVRKLWGPRRIREDLFARGFPSEVVAVAMEALEDVDFSNHCARVIRKKYGSVPVDPAEKKKMVAALMRLGYTSDQIREAMRSI